MVLLLPLPTCYWPRDLNPVELFSGGNTVIVDLFPHSALDFSAIGCLSTSVRASMLDRAAHPSHCLCVLDCAEGAFCWRHTVLLKILKRTSHTPTTPVGSRRL